MHPIVVIAASAGGLPPLRQIAAALPKRCMGSIFVVLHIGSFKSNLPEILSFSGPLPASFGKNDSCIEAGHIYVAPPDWHMLLQLGRIRLDHGAKVHFTRPAADPLFISAAYAYGKSVMGVVLSGGDGDGAEGLRIIKEHGGLCLVQSPEEAHEPSMPHKALMVDHPVPASISEIAQRVRAFCN